MNQNPYSFGWLPINISTHGADIDRLIYYLHIFMLVLFVGWGAYFLYCLVRFRERAGHQADLGTQHFKLPTYIEGAVLLIEVLLLVFVSSPIWGRVKNEFPPEKDAVVIRIVAEQFAWNIHYPGRDGKFGKTVPEKMDGTNPVGLDRDDADAKDDLVTINQLHIPVNKPVIVKLSSKDVIHSFFLPVMRVKQDAIPGMEIPIHFEATQTGEFEIACAQLCGLGHYRMRGTFKVDTAEEYAAFLAEQEKDQLGSADTTGPGASAPPEPAEKAAGKEPADKPTREQRKEPNDTTVPGEHETKSEEGTTK